MKYAFLLIIVIIIGFIWYGRQSNHTEPRHYQIARARLPHPPVPPLLIKERGELPVDVSRELPSPLQGEGSGGEVFGAPVAEFSSRITKKPFGIYITPETSPIEHDRWTGYHTGVDVEYEDIPGDVKVRAITDGEIILNRFATGYGGIIVIRHNIYGQDILALYGHLDPDSLPKNFKKVKQGQIIGVLGDGGTDETDGARKHLHFALIKKDVGSTGSTGSTSSLQAGSLQAGSPQALDIRGYVKNQEELSGWYDPQEFYKAK